MSDSATGRRVRDLALAEGLGSRVDVAERADGHDRDGGEIVAEVEGLRDRVAVEATHLVRVQTGGMGLNGEVGGGLAGVVRGPGQRLAVERRDRREHDERGGVRSPASVEAHERVDDHRVCVGAAACDDEAGGLGVVGRGGPPGCLERAAQRLFIDRGDRVVHTGAPALGEHVEDGGVGLRGAIEGEAHGISKGGTGNTGDAIGPSVATSSMADVFPISGSCRHLPEWMPKAEASPADTLNP